MAEMSPRPLTSFAAYKSKLEATRQLEMEKSIKKALAQAGLNEQDGVPFMRVRVVGLTTWNYHGKGRPKEGIITIWNPIEKQKVSWLRGRIYCCWAYTNELRFGNPLFTSLSIYHQLEAFISPWQWNASSKYSSAFSVIVSWFQATSSCLSSTGHFSARKSQSNCQI